MTELGAEGITSQRGVDKRKKIGCAFGHDEPLPTSAHPLMARLREERIRKRISLKELSRTLGYDIFTLGGWERGRSVPSVIKFSDWCDALGVKLEIGDMGK